MRVSYFSFLILLEAILSAQPIQAGPIPQTMHPYTAEFIEANSPDQTTVQAMRSDGTSVRRGMAIGSLRGLESVTITIETDESYTLVDPVNRAKRTYGPRPVHMQNVFDPTCRTREKTRLGQWTLVSDDEQILGIPVLKWSFRSTDPEHPVEREEWLAPACNCLALRRRSVVYEEDGTINNVSDYIATKVILGEPDEELFQISPDVKEVSPGEFLKYIEARHNIP